METSLPPPAPTRPLKNPRNLSRTDLSSESRNSPTLSASHSSTFRMEISIKTGHLIDSDDSPSDTTVLLGGEVLNSINYDRGGRGIWKGKWENVCDPPRGLLLVEIAGFGLLEIKARPTDEIHNWIFDKRNVTISNCWATFPQTMVIRYRSIWIHFMSFVIDSMIFNIEWKNSSDFGVTLF